MINLFKKITICLIIIMAGRDAKAQSIERLGPNYFAAGIPSNEFEFYTLADYAGRQRCEEWCWAASVQMILNYHGLYVTQEQVVTKIFGGLECVPGNPSEISEALSGWAPNTHGGASQIYCQDGPTTAVEIVSNLAYKSPLLACLSNGDGSGHAVVVTGIYYSVDQYNNPIVDKVVIRDPWPFNPSRQEMPWAEFVQRLTDIFKVWVE